MRFVKEQGAQGDVFFCRVQKFPEAGLVEQARDTQGRLIVAHSETGHHHAIAAADAHLLEYPGSLVAYLRVDGEYADVVHHRDYDTHETLRLGRGLWEVRRQREYSAERAWQRVAD